MQLGCDLLLAHLKWESPDDPEVLSWFCKTTHQCRMMHSPWSRKVVNERMDWSGLPQSGVPVKFEATPVVATLWTMKQGGSPICLDFREAR